MDKIDLVSLSRQELEDWVIDIGEKSFRASQLWSWIYQRGTDDFSAMTNIAKTFRTRLEQVAVIGTLKLADETISSSGTRKFLFQLEDGYSIESVYIPESRRRTVCLSTQVGCTLGCRFCATGTLGFNRNLTASEIVGQLLSIRRMVGEKPTNIVVMGMGEPLLNYDPVIKALQIINHRDGLAIGHRKITISTAGMVPQIRRYTREKHPFRLAVSLNATTDTLRSQLMPVNRKYALKDLLQAVREYTQTSRKRVTFEYVLLEGINDSLEDAGRLISLLRGIPCKVNLIAYNATSPQFRRPSEDRIAAFAETIRPLCAPVTLRLSRGDDINGACGQLAARQLNMSS